jgi:ABC-type glutathione transport system ATPase component
MKEILDVKIEEVSVKKDLEYLPILKNISFGLQAGKIYTIIGKNGIGKSTLFRTISRLLDDNFYKINCKIVFNDRNIYELNNEELLYLHKDKMKYVLQDAIGSFDPLKKIGYYFKLDNFHKEKIEELTKYFLLPDLPVLSALYPYEVSGGMAQRISLILSLLAEPELLLLDEPTSSLDVAVVNLLLNKLKVYVQTGNRTILLVTQDILLAEKISTQIALLENGSLSEFSEPEIFFNKNKNLISSWGNNE